MRCEKKKKVQQEGVQYGKQNYFRLSQCGIKLCPKVCNKQMKWSSALSSLKNGIFQKGALHFLFCYLHIITRMYYFEVTY